MIKWLQRNMMSGVNPRQRSLFISGALLLVLSLIYIASSSDFPISTRLYSKHQGSSDSARASLATIPEKIWQIYFGYSDLGDQIALLNTWLLKNQDYSYTLVSNKGANTFAQKNYFDRPDVLNTFMELQLPVFRSDLLRYMLLETEGGVYSDLDTDNLHPVSEWVPQELRSRVSAVVGIEYDQLGREAYTGMSEPLQFCQWTMATSRNHPIAKKAVEKVVAAIRRMARENGTQIADLEPLDEDVIKVTGPVIWTKVVMEALSEATGTSMSYLNMTGMTEPRLFGDIYVLPVNAFGAGQSHSNSWVQGGNPPEALVRHIWKGSWKHGLGNKFSGGLKGYTANFKTT